MLTQPYQEFTSLKSKMVHDIISCQSKDDSGLNDFQKLPAQELVAIPRVGINRYRLPILMRNKEGHIRSHDAEASMFVGLNEKKNGVSMSRLVTILQQESFETPLSFLGVKKIIDRYRDELRDETDTDLIDEAQIKFSFNFPVQQKSLKSDNWGWQYYPVEIVGKHTKEKGFQYQVSLVYEYSSTCPCSLSMAKQYEREFQEGKITEGVGIGVPHSQRSKLKTTMILDASFDGTLEDLVMILKTAIPTETQSLVKRLDEQAFAILNGTHPMFVEHASKRLYATLNEQSFITDWLCQLEHIESLHSHNAAAVIYKGIENGLRADTIF